MKNVRIYEPAMCCSTGLCGTSIDPELLRISTVLDALERRGFKVARYNLSSAPEAFAMSGVVTEFMRNRGVAGLPVTVVDGSVAVAGRYPSNEELCAWAGVSLEVDGEPSRGGCCCKGGCC